MLERCIHTNLLIPECSCSVCLRGMVARHAPELVHANVVRLGDRRDVDPPPWLQPPAQHTLAR